MTCVINKLFLNKISRHLVAQNEFEQGINLWKEILNRAAMPTGNSSSKGNDWRCKDKNAFYCYEAVSDYMFCFDSDVKDFGNQAKSYIITKCLWIHIETAYNKIL